MCGIVGYVGSRQCTEVLIDALSKLEYRGYDSAGIAVFDNGEIKVAKSKGRLKDLENKMEKEELLTVLRVSVIQDGLPTVNLQMSIPTLIAVRELRSYITV